MIHLGDCVTVMAGMPADSVDAVCTDPPYGLEFMGKGWDKFDARESGGFKTGGLGTNIAGRKAIGPVYSAGSPFQAWCEAWGREALRVTKPGGYLLAFGGTRTHHRLVCGLEDAGWIIRDELDWIYASGFPKGKANLKPAHEPIVLARKPGPLRPLNIEETRIGTGATIRQSNAGTNGDGWGMGASEHVNGSEAGRWPSNLLLSDPELFDEPNPYVVGSGATATSGSRTGEYDGSGAWSGPFGSVSEDIEGSSGGYSRFFLVPKSSRADREPNKHAPSYGSGERWPMDATPGSPVLNAEQVSGRDAGKAERAVGKSAAMTSAPAIAGESPSIASGPSGALACATCSRLISGQEWQSGVLRCGHPHKASYRQKPHAPRVNTHATVKPTDLMRHLVRLVTPSGGTVLDPFLGSGSTAIACELEGFPWIGIEQDASYVAIAEARLNGVQRGLGLDYGSREPAA